MIETPLGIALESIRNGMNVKQDKSGEGIPVTRIETISNSEVNASRVGYANLSYDDCKEWLLEPGDILFSHINSVEHVGKCAIYRGSPKTLAHGMNLLRLRCAPNIAYPDYIVRVVRSPLVRSRMLPFVNRAVNQASISIANLKQICVPLPPLSEQRRITATLDHIDMLRTKRHEAIALLDDLVQSIFLDMFGDPSVNASNYAVCELESLVADDDRINYGVVQPGQHVEDGIPLIRAGDLEQLGVDRSSLMRISPEIESSYSRSRIKGIEILIGCVGAIGKVSVVNSKDIGSNVARAVARVPVADDFDREYIAAYLRMDFTQRYFTKELRTVAQPTLNIKQIKSAPVVLPPTGSRRKFTERARMATRKREAHVAHLAALDELFVSLQQRAFSGTLWDHGGEAGRA